MVMVKDHLIRFARTKLKVETEAWFAGLRSLISTGQCSRRTRSDISDLNGGDFIQNSSRPFSATLEATSSFLRIAHSKSSDFSSREPPSNTTSSDVGSDRANMQLGLQGWRMLQPILPVVSHLLK